MSQKKEKLNWKIIPPIYENKDLKGLAIGLGIRKDSEQSGSTIPTVKDGLELDSITETKKWKKGR